MLHSMKKVMLLFALAFAHLASAQTRTEGMTAMQLKNWDEAITIYSGLTKSNPADQDAWLTLGNAYLAKGDKVQADAAFKSAFDAKPDGPMAFVANARRLMLSNDMTGVETQIVKAKKYAKKDMATHRQIGESFLFHIPTGSNRPNHTRAIELLNQALDVNSKDFETRMALAFAYKELPNGGLAVQQYELAAALEPKNPLPVMMLSKAYKTAKLPAKFEENIDRAIALDPKYVPALRERALHYYYDRQWAKALEASRALINSGANGVTIDDEMLLANLLYINKQYPDAITLIDRIIAKDGSRNYLRRISAYIKYEQKEYPEGLRMLNEYFQTAPKDKIIARDYAYLGRLQLATGGDTATAAMNLFKSIELDSTTWDVYSEIARLNFAQKKYCDAAANYAIYVDSLASPFTTEEPKATDFYTLGTYQYSCKDDSMRYVKAEQSFARVTEMNPKAGIGWLWRARAAAKSDPDPNEFEARPELVNEFGKAREFFEQYVGIASVDPNKNKEGLIQAYEYLTYYYFLRKDATNFNSYSAKLLELDPENVTGKGLKESFEGGK
jgi:Flp pilus assembly protein TadD